VTSSAEPGTVSGGATGGADELATERRLGPRFGPEAGLIVGAAAFAALLELSWPGVIAVVLCAWLAVAIFEIVRARVRPAAAEAEPAAPQAGAFVAPPHPQAEPELPREPEPEPTLPAERPSESPRPEAAGLLAPPEHEPHPPSEPERRP
jgi:hypothetical protein